MKISYNWLKQYLDFDLSPDDLSVLLTDCGLEVEGLEKWQSVKGGMEGIMIGEVKTCVKHPDADRLSVTTVDVGTDELLPIVCGAPNVATGQKVVVATVGTTLYSGDDSFVIKKAKLRGQPSEGMICAEDEIGLGTDHDGIMVLDPNAKIGMPAADYFGLEEDYIFEIGLTPNRTDAMSHIGVARDIKAVLDCRDFEKGNKTERKLKLPYPKSFSSDNNSLDIPVEVKNIEACPRYTGVTIAGVKVQQSPDWLKHRLEAIGLRPINNVVDITNYVLHETGQPLHAFDVAEIVGNKVVVKKMEEGTSFTTLDEIERKLTNRDLMICNADNGMCIGGVFGGINSGVTEKTTDVFLESACFDPVHIRKTARHHDLQTDASFRFERGIDPNNTPEVLKRAALLIKEIAGGSIASEIKDVYPETVNLLEVKVKWAHIHRLIGKTLEKDLILNILRSLEFEILNESEEEILVRIPLYRVDVTREADVIEEILRIYGFNKIEIPQSLRSATVNAPKPDVEKIRNRLASYLSNNGYREIMNNSLTKSAYYENNADFNEAESVAMLNPLSRDLNVMRQSLLYGGLETIAYNQNRKNEDLKLFEFGSVYSYSPDKDKTEEVIKRYHESEKLCLFISGKINPESWYEAQKSSDFNQLKAIGLNILQMAGIVTNNCKVKETTANYYAYGLSFELYKKEILKIGSISKPTLNQFDIRNEVFYAEIDFSLVLHQSSNESLFAELPKFPEVRRDLALLVDTAVSYAEIEQISFETERNLLKNVNLFDVYEGKNLGDGKKSYAVSFTLLDENKTLTDKVIDKCMNRLIKAYQDKLGATIR